MSDYKTHLSNSTQYCVLPVSIKYKNFYAFSRKNIAKTPKEMKLKIPNGKRIQGRTWKIRRLAKWLQTGTHLHTQ